MWTFDPSKGQEPIEGLPLQADDKTFDAAVERYEAQFEDRIIHAVEDAEKVVKTVMAKGSVKLSGLWKHTPDPKSTPAEPAKEGE